LCTHGCPKHEHVRYDADGYNQFGYHRDSGLSREGVPRPQNALPFEEHADAVEPRVRNGNVVDEYDDDESDIWEAFDDAEVANEGWDNVTWGDHRGADSLGAGNNPGWSDGPFNHIDDGIGVSIPAGLLEFANGGVTFLHADNNNPGSMDGRPFNRIENGNSVVIPAGLLRFANGLAAFIHAGNNYPNSMNGPFNHISAGNGVSIPTGLLEFAKIGHGLGYHTASTNKQTNFHGGGRVIASTFDGWGMDDEGYDVHGFGMYQ
jgi:hypothetical protein